jgi:hypothetical protein
VYYMEYFRLTRYREECERCWGPSMQLTGGWPYALQTRVIGSSGDAVNSIIKCNSYIAICN